MAEKIQYSQRERNVPTDVWEAWKTMRKRTDMAAIKKLTGKSTPVISAALNRGFVNDPKLADQITDYFNNRPTEVKVDKRKANQLIEKTKAL